MSAQWRPVLLVFVLFAHAFEFPKVPQAQLKPIGHCNIAPLVHSTIPNVSRVVFRGLCKQLRIWEASTLNGTAAITLHKVKKGFFRMTSGLGDFDAVVCNRVTWAYGFRNATKAARLPCFRWCQQRLNDPVVVTNVYFSEHHSHFLTDHLPVLYLAALSMQEAGYAFRPAIHLSRRKKKWLQFLDNTTFANPYWLNRSKVYCGDGLIIGASVDPAGVYGMKYPDVVANVWSHIQDAHPRHDEGPDHDLVIYYSRNGENTFGGRRFKPYLEEQVISTITSTMRKYSRREKFVVFTGMKGDDIMPPEEQFRLFSRAAVVVGVQGTGMVNTLFLPRRTPCHRRPHVVEVTCGPHMQDIVFHQPGCSRMERTYFAELGAAAWTNWHVIPALRNSTPQWFYIDLADLRDALRSVWEPDYLGQLIAKLPFRRFG